MSEVPLLIDVSRLIWRQWTRRLPTGIDRVCLAYLQHFHSNARAVIQFRRFRRILHRKDSARLFDLLLSGGDGFRSKLVITLAVAALNAESSTAGQIYLNVGHTGLDSRHLEAWLRARRLRPVYLVHDLIPITHPEYCREGEAKRHERRMATALRTACGLILNSAATQDDVENFAHDSGLKMPASVVAWLGADVGQSPAKTNAVLRQRPYFVMIGTIEARKNHLLMLKVWKDLLARLGGEAPDLMVIGQRGWEADEAIAILEDPGPLQGYVHELGRCDDRMMSQMLAGAQAMLMPSFTEGFGLPLVEALQQGVPVIASDLPVFRELAADIPTYLDPSDEEAWTAMILDYSANGPERQRQLEVATEFRPPDWSTHFAVVEEFLETL